MTRKQKKQRRDRSKLLVDRKRWIGYATAAAATAGAGHEDAEAALTYVNPEPDILVQAAPGTGSVTVSTQIDLNGDSTNDFEFLHRITPGGLGRAFVDPLGNNQIAGFVNIFRYASNLPASASVGILGNFLSSGVYGSLASSSGLPNPQFLMAGPAFLGVRFDSAEGSHFGWIRVDMSGAPLNAFTINDWVYGDAQVGAPGESVHVGTIPEPGSLGLLATGAAGLLAWRRKRRLASGES